MKTVLAIDGGGVRGIIPTRVLAALQERLDQPLACYFDIIAGTSSGAITALSLAQPGSAEPEHLTSLFLQQAPRMFSRGWRHRLHSVDGWLGPKYDEVALESLFKEAFGDLKLSDLERPVMVPAVNVERDQATFFCRPQDKVGQLDYHLCDVLRATTAAPTYFRPATIQCTDGSEATFVDGGLFANNPAMYAAAAVESTSWLGLRQQPISVVSIGTGLLTRPFPTSEAEGWGKLRWIQPVIQMMGSGLDSAISYAIHHGFDAEHYFRFQIALQRDLGDRQAPKDDLDDCSPENLALLVEWGDRLVADEKESLDRAAKILLKRGQRVTNPKITDADVQRVLTELTPMAGAMGITCSELGWGSCKLALDAGADYVRPGGSVIGPAMMTMADVGLYIAILSQIGLVPMAVTSNFNINFLSRPALGELIADARVIKLGRRLAYGEVSVYGAADPARLAAHATITYALPSSPTG